MSRLTRSLSAEFRKIFATKMWWILGIVILVYSALMGGTFAAMFGLSAEALGDMGVTGAQSGLDEVHMVKTVLSSVSGFSYVVPLLLGAIMATGELRHKILGLAFVAEPKREIVLVAKIIVLLVIGAILGVIGLIGAGGAGAIFLHEGWLHIDTLLLGLRTIATIAMWAVIGFGVGLLVRNQAVTIVLVLVFTQFVEPMLRVAAMFWDWSANLAKFLPGSASDGFVGASVLGDMGAMDPSIEGVSTTLDVLPAFFVLLAYAIITVFGGWATRWRGDIT